MMYYGKSDHKSFFFFNQNIKTIICGYAPGGFFINLVSTNLENGENPTSMYLKTFI